MISVQSLVEALINSKNGWSVAEQFTDTYSGEERFETQNYTAMEMVAAAVKELLSSELLAEGYELEELRGYHSRLEDYLSNP